jgi:pimeloyl-ACP methyl ester carboxylesterase
MEKFLTIKTPDNHTIYWTLNSKNKSDKLVIFVHGLGWNQNEHIFFNWAKFFNNNSFDTFRFDLYPWEKWRNLVDCWITTHTQDLEIVIQEFIWKYKGIYLVGHSLGGPTILLANIQNIKKVILRDPVLDTKRLYDDEIKFDKERNLYTINWWIDIIIWEKMVEEMKSIENLNPKLNEKYKIIYAEKTDLKNDFKANIENITIKKSSHCFNEEGIEEILFQETLNRFLS